MLKISYRRIPQELIPELNQALSNEDFEAVLKNYDLQPLEEYNSYVTAGKEGVEVFGIMYEGGVLVYDGDDGWHSLSEEKWIYNLWNYSLCGYSDDSKLIFIRTIPHLSEYSPKIRFIDDRPLLLFEWSISKCFPNSYIVLAHTELEARHLVYEKLGNMPDDLKQDPVVHTKPVSFVSIGEYDD